MAQRPPRIVGYFDGVEGARASGWAVSLDAPAAALDIAFFRIEPDGRRTLIGQVRADRPRDDLRAVGFDATNHGFAWDLPESNGGWRLSARVAGTGPELPGSPVEIGETAPEPRIIGQLDGAEGGHALGWAADLDQPDRVIEIEFFDITPGRPPTLLGRAGANRPRRDLRKTGLARTRYGFDWSIPAVPEALLLSARIAGHTVELPGSPVAVAAQVPPSRIVGRLDAVEGSHALGWAADLDQPDRVVEIEFFDVTPGRPPTPLGRARANRPRRDLRKAGLGTTRHGFDWRIPFAPGGLVLSARVVSHDFELPGSPATVAPRPLFEGSFDGISRGVVRGWAWAWDPAIEVGVEVFVDGKLRGAALARTERPDLAVAGVGDGRYGFAWIVPDDVADGAPHKFACRIAGTAQWLSGSPKTAAITPGSRSPALTPRAETRGVAPRPALSRVNGQPYRAARFPLLPAAAPAIAKPAAPPAAPCHSVKLLIPVWGEDYIAAFCRTVLPGFLSPNNLPHLVRHHRLTVCFLTRDSERHLFDSVPAYQRLRRLAGVEFLAIDDILAACFDTAPDAYATALTYAFHRGVASLGTAALDTDFVFWDADFVAADGVFRTLAEVISAGVRCTFAPSLRLDPAAEAAIPASCRSHNGSILDMGPRDWTALAMRFLHPTVKAQTVNRYEERMIDTVNQLYWHVDDRLMVARVFLMFMLHIRPERLWDEVYGHCDYVFVPEMVPSGEHHFETDSDRMLIIELQHRNREWQEIVYGDRAMTPAEVARGVARWTTREHRLAARQLVVFNAGDARPDLTTIRRTTDAFMDDVFRRLPAEPIWHNGHFFWTDSLAALGLDYAAPGPDHPRSHLAAALRATGYDIDALRESWPGADEPPAGVFDLELPLDLAFDVAKWRADVEARYLRAWRTAKASVPAGLSRLDLISGHFHGFGWGPVEHDPAGWIRRLGPGARATLLLAVPAPRAVHLRLDLVGDPAALGVSVNGCDLQPQFGTGGSASIAIGRDLVAAAGGRLEIAFSADATNRLGFRSIAATTLPVRALSRRRSRSPSRVAQQSEWG